MKQKTLYTFNVTTKDGDKEVNSVVGIYKPTRRQREESQLVYSTKYGELIDRGILPAAALQKKMLDAGLLTDPDQMERFEGLVKRLTEKSTEYQGVMTDLENKEANKDKIDGLIKDIAILTEQVREFEAAKIDTSQHTAESHAYEETVRWIVLNLSVVKNAEDEKAEFAPMFKGLNDKEKLNALDDKEDSEEPVYMKSIGKLYHAAALIHFGLTDEAKVKELVDKG